MARTQALSLLKAAGTAADLAEIYGIVVEAIQKETISGALKSNAYNGNPAAGSVEFKRFTNSASAVYGSARTNGGVAITGTPITCNLSTHREIVEEAAKFDLDTYGVANIMSRRAANHIDTLASELDVAFFSAAITASTATNTTETAALARLEALILDVETVNNTYVRGVPRNMIAVVCSPAFFSSVRSGLDSLPRVNVDSAAEEFGTYHGTKIYSSINVTTVDAVAMAIGSVAQPVLLNQYSEPEKIPLSNDFAISLFFDYGTKSLADDVIFNLPSTPVALADIDVTSEAATGTNHTKLTAVPAAASGNKFVYKLGASYTDFEYDDTLTTGWTDFTSGSTNIDGAAHTKATVAEVTATGRARGRGVAVLVKTS